MKLPISAIVVGYNEQKLLEKCLPQLSFCDEILYFDLGSSDDSIATATKFGAKITLHEKVDSCEWIHTKYADKTKNEWVLITDPDEIIGPGLIDSIFQLFNTGITKNIGSITAPWIFYFKGKKLTGTNWGGINRRVLLVNNKRFEFLPLIHVSRQLLKGYEQYDILYNDDNYISHFWMESYYKLIEKHLRYLRNEAEARYFIGRTVTFKNIIKEPYRAFRYSFITKKGNKDGFKGLFLSFFWAWYETSAQLRTYFYQKKMAEKSNQRI